MSTDPFAPIAPHLKTTYQISLYMVENAVGLSKDAVIIINESGNGVFKIEAPSSWSLSNRRNLVDLAHANVKTVGQIRKKRYQALHPIMYIGTPDDEKHCMVQLKEPFNISSSCDADIYLADKVIGEVNGNWRAKEFNIKVNGILIVKVERNKRKLNSYCINISGGWILRSLC